MTLGENIERLRIAAGHTNAAEFARKIGVSPGTLGDWEKGRYKDLRLDNLFRLAKGIPCTMDELIIGVDPDYEAWVASQSAADTVWKRRYAREQAHVAATRTALGHKIGEMAALVSRLPGEQAPMARRGESESAAHRRRRGGRADSRGAAKPTAD